MSWINKQLFFTIIMIGLTVIVIELLATLAVHYKYKKHNPSLSQMGYSSTMFILDRALTRLSLKEGAKPTHELVIPFPKPLYGPSKLHG